MKNFDIRQSAQEREFSNTVRQQEGGETERQIYALSWEGAIQVSSIGYTNRSIVWKCVFPMHVLNKKENINNA